MTSNHNEDIEIISGIWDDLFSDEAALSTAVNYECITENGNASLQIKEPIMSDVQSIELSDKAEFNADLKYDMNATNNISYDNCLQTKVPTHIEMCNQEYSDNVLNADMKVIDPSIHRATKIKTEKSIFSQKRSIELSHGFNLKSPFRPFKYLRSDIKEKHRSRSYAAFNCHMCSKSFFHKRYLHAHLRTHTEEKPFV